MKLKQVLLISISILFSINCLSSVANASLINTDYLSTGDGLILKDDVNNLEWLSWSLTGSVSIDDAENQFAGYHIATKDEWYGLFDQIFKTFDAGDTHGSIRTGSASSETGSNSNHTAERNMLNQLLGTAYKPGFNYGLFKDGDFTRLGGSYQNSPIWVTFKNNSDYTANDDNDFGGVKYSVMMVRSTEVPEPSTLAILALGMIGLASRRFKKES